ncbi:MAG: sulfatase-like hydrolase/transferase [Elusimicrobiota bacterium]|nr:sulfatase-like hydrolase/transferase [Elusimicrobiota bacterium]
MRADLYQGLVLAFLLATPYLAESQGHAPADRWPWADPALWTVVAAAAAALGGLTRLAGSRRDGGRLRAAWLAAAWAACVWLASRPAGGAFFSSERVSDPVLLAALGLFVALAAGPGAAAAARACETAALAMGPVLLLSAFSCLRAAGAAPTPRVPLPARAGDARPSVFVFLFDGWSRELSFPGGRPRPGLDNLAALMEVSTFHADARSPHFATEESVPRILFGACGDAGWRGRPSLFVGPRAAGWRTVLAGWVAPYPAPDERQGVDLFALTDGRRAPTPFLARLPIYAYALLRPHLARLRPGEDATGSVLVLATLGLEEIHALAMETISRDDEPLLALFHYPIPHPPLVHGRAGFDPRAEYAPDAAAAGLEHLDRVVGELVARLKAAGRFDASAIVLLSDHGRRFAGEDPTRVPLLVKAPGQRAARRATGRFELCRLDALIGALAAGRSP